MRSAAALCCVVFLCSAASSLVVADSFVETFGEGWDQRWTHSTDDKYQGRFVVDTLKPDVALKIPKKAVHYGLTAALESPFHPADGVILQFEAKYSTGQTCSGAYIKFYSQDPNFKPADVKADTPYTVMFGPDVCGTTSKVHLILNHKSPKTGEISEKHLKSPPRVKTDKKTHVYTTVLKTDNTFEVMVDDKVVEEGSLLEKFDPPINPPPEIPDPEDKKPEDWVDNAQMDDPDAVKPEDWVEDPMMEDLDAVKPEGWLDDEQLEIADPDAVKPEDWNDEEDGDWVAPTIRNPKCKAAPGCGEWLRPKKSNPEYKGPWKPPKIDNPAYKGPWKQATIPNPDHYVDERPLQSMAPIASLGFELWTMDEGIFFDHVIVTKDADLAASYRQKWSVRNELEKQEEEEEMEKKKQEAAAKKKEGTSSLRRFLELPVLSTLAPHLEPVVAFLESQGIGFYGFIGVLFSLLFSSLLRRCFRSGKTTDVGRRKKLDVSEPDDPPQENAPESSSVGDSNRNEEGDEDEKETPKGQKSRRSN